MMQIAIDKWIEAPTEIDLLVQKKNTLPPDQWRRYVNSFYRQIAEASITGKNIYNTIHIQTTSEGKKSVDYVNMINDLYFSFSGDVTSTKKQNSDSFLDLCFLKHRMDLNVEDVIIYIFYSQSLSITAQLPYYPLPDELEIISYSSEYYEQVQNLYIATYRELATSVPAIKKYIKNSLKSTFMKETHSKVWF